MAYRKYGFAISLHDLKEDTIEIIKLKYDDLNFNVEEIVYEVLHGEVHGGLNLNEFVFYSYFKKQGYRVLRLPHSTKNKSCFYEDINLKKEFDMDTKMLYEKGVPDFMVIKDNKYCFIEAKDIRDWLSPNQIEWQEKYRENTKIIRYAPISNGDRLLLDSEIITSIRKTFKGRMEMMRRNIDKEGKKQ